MVGSGRLKKKYEGGNKNIDLRVKTELTRKFQNQLIEYEVVHQNVTLLEG